MRGNIIAFIALVGRFAVAAPLEEPVETPATAEGGGPGETCANRQDCRAGLRCVAETCRDPREGQTCSSTADCGSELKCIRHQCTSLAAMMRSSSEPEPRTEMKPDESKEETKDEDWLGFDFSGSHPFVGITQGGGVATTLSTQNNRFSGTGQSTIASSAFLFALRFGVFRDKTEISFEVAPMTYEVPFASACFQSSQFAPPQCVTASGTVFQANGTVGFWLPLVQTRHVGVYWPIRLGVGFLETTNGVAFFEAVGDVVGAVVRVGHLTFGMRIPTFRYAFTPDTNTSTGGHILTWAFNGDIGYIF